MRYTPPNLNQFSYVSSYYLSTIISADGSDSINFNYIADEGYGVTILALLLLSGNNVPLVQHRQITISQLIMFQRLKVMSH